MASTNGNSNRTDQHTDQQKVVSLAAWSTDKSDQSYDIEEFYTRSSDKQGHRSEVRVNIEPRLADAIGALIASKEIPTYRMPADVLRDALVHRLHHIKKGLPRPRARHIDNILASIQGDERIAAINAERAWFRQHILTLERSVEDAIEDGDIEAQEAVCRDEREMVMEWRDPYCTKALKLIAKLEAKLAEATTG